MFILTAAKNHTSNFADRTVGPDYCTSSNASLTAPSNRNYCQTPAQSNPNTKLGWVDFVNPPEQQQSQPHQNLAASHTGEGPNINVTWYIIYVIYVM